MYEIIYRSTTRVQFLYWQEFYYSLPRQTRIWGQLSPLSNSYWGSFLELSFMYVKLTTHHYLVSRLRVSGANFLLPHTSLWRGVEFYTRPDFCCFTEAFVVRLGEPLP
jgi:hypothetical protein